MLMAGFDMHVHSSASDGAMAPADLIVMAKKQGLLGMAITDHDTTAGFEEAAAKAAQLDFVIISGIELSTEIHNKDIHILGYWVDVDIIEHDSVLQLMHQARFQRCYDIVSRLSRLGIKLDADKIITDAGPIGVPGRPHIAFALVEAGYAKSIKEAFSKWLDRGMPGYVPRAKLNPEKAVEIIISAGGVPVLAHPGTGAPDSLIAELVAIGLGGIEVYHPDHNKQAEQKYLIMAKRFHIAATGGSDFHTQGRRQLGSRITTLKQLALLSQKREDLLNS
jgi:3',5'-nucleoside bisphosphate phosphatase